MTRRSLCRPIDLVVWGAAVALLASGLPHAAAATPAPQAAYQSECGACHAAFPPRLLRPADWTRVLGSLDHHYGVDASLDPQTLGVVGSHLGVKAPTAASDASAKTLPRITTSPWFREEHDEISASTWTLPAVKTPANCAACHAGAERGDFDEDSVRLPQGAAK